MFQSYALFPHMTVAQNIAFGLEMRGSPKEKVAGVVEEMLALVKMTGLGGRRPAQLSGGQQQRVALARALANHPDVLLLDEPLSALDLKLRQEMRSELKNLQRRTGITFVFVTHDQEEALTLSDRVAIMNGGKIEQMGTPRELYEGPATDFVANFLGVSNIFDGRVTGRDGGEALVVIGPIHVRAPWEDGLEVGGPIRVAVRPEKIRLGPRQAKEGLPARVCHVVYLGATTHFYLETLGGQSVVVHVQNVSADTAPWAPGGEVTCHLEPKSVFVLGKG